MCQFFSLISDGHGKAYYFDAKARAALRESNLWGYEPDSHTSIAALWELDEDKCNKYEYNPFLQRFCVDQTNTRDDRRAIKKFCQDLDFKTIVPELVLHPIVKPFDRKGCPRINKQDKENLAMWASVRDSVEASVRDSVWASVWESVWAYASSFFDLPKWKYINHEPGQNPFQPCIDLWNRGLVPSFVGETWRLHGGPKAKILFEATPQELKAIAETRQ